MRLWVTAGTRRVSALTHQKRRGRLRAVAPTRGCLNEIRIETFGEARLAEVRVRITSEGDPVKLRLETADVADD